MRSTPTLDGGFVGERQERVRLLRTQADLAEIELSKQRSQLVSIEDVQKEWTDLCETVTAVMMAIPSQLAPQLVGQTSRMMVHAKIEAALKEALLRLSRR